MQHSDLITVLICFFSLSFIGWLLLFSGIYGYIKARNREQTEFAYATGVITDYKTVVHTYRSRTRGRSRRQYSLLYPIIRFEDRGKTYQFTWNMSVPAKKYPVGTVVDVHYDPNDPSHAHPNLHGGIIKPNIDSIRIGVIWIPAAAVFTAILSVSSGVDPINEVSDFVYHLNHPAAKIQQIELSTSGGESVVFNFTTQTDSTVVITGYTGPASEINIPPVLAGHVVSGISTSAFSSHSLLYKITVPGTVQMIPAGAFAGCLRLTEVVLSEGVTTIQTNAFSFCPLLKNITLPSSLRKIENDAFSDDCTACFHISPGSSAEKYCFSKGFTTEAL